MGLLKRLTENALHTAASIYVCECFGGGRGKFRVLLKAGMWNTDCGPWNGKCGMGNIMRNGELEKANKKCKKYLNEEE